MTLTRVAMATRLHRLPVGSPHWQRPAVLLFLSLMTAFAVVRTVTYLLTDPDLGHDVHGYWFYGHFLRQGQDPHQAFFSDLHPALPVHYLDGYIEQARLLGPAGVEHMAPSNAAPVFLLLYPLSYLSWPTVVALWTALLIVLAAIVPWLVQRLLPIQFDTFGRVGLALLFYSLVATRSAIITGQTTLLVLTLMTAAVLLTQRRQRLLAGLALGIALSKYSLAAPVLLLLLYRRQFSVLLAALATQIAAMLALALIGHTHPMTVLLSHVEMFRYHLAMDQTGVELTAILPDNRLLELSALGLLTLVVFGSMAASIAGDRFGRLRSRVGDLWILSTLSLWTILVVYHRGYDLVLVLFPLILLAGELHAGSLGATRQTSVVRCWVTIVLAATAAGLLMPGSSLEVAIPGWATFNDVMTTSSVLLLLAGLLWYGARLRSGDAALAPAAVKPESPA